MVREETSRFQPRRAHVSDRREYRGITLSAESADAAPDHQRGHLSEIDARCPLVDAECLVPGPSCWCQAALSAGCLEPGAGCGRRVRSWRPPSGGLGVVGAGFDPDL